MLGTVEAHLARGGIEGDDAHALLETIDAGADFLDHSGQFVAEESRGNDHGVGVVAPLVHLQVGAAGECNLHFDEDLAVTDAGDGDFFDFQIFFAVQDGSGHFSVHCVSFRVMPNQSRGLKPRRIESPNGAPKAAPFQNLTHSKSCAFKTLHRPKCCQVES